MLTKSHSNVPQLISGPSKTHRNHLSLLTDSHWARSRTITFLWERAWALIGTSWFIKSIKVDRITSDQIQTQHNSWPQITKKSRAIKIKIRQRQEETALEEKDHLKAQRQLKILNFRAIISRIRPDDTQNLPLPDVQTAFSPKITTDQCEPKGADHKIENSPSIVFEKGNVMDRDDRVIEHSKLPQSMDKFLQGHKWTREVEALESYHGRWKWWNLCQVNQLINSSINQQT